MAERGKSAASAWDGDLATAELAVRAGMQWRDGRRCEPSLTRRLAGILVHRSIPVPGSGCVEALRTWVWLGLGLSIGAVAGLAAGNLAAGFGVGAALGITFAYVLDRRRHR